VEVTYLMVKGRIPTGAMARLRAAVEERSFGFRTSVLDLAVADAIQRIRRQDVPDLPDRVIAVTALALNLPLVTRDGRIRSAMSETIWQKGGLPFMLSCVDPCVAGRLAGRLAGRGSVAGQSGAIYDGYMRAALVVSSLVLLNLTASGRSAAKASAFEVASVKPSQRALGPDANNLFAFEPAGISARNVTLRRLVAEAYRLQLSQVLGPAWLDQSEYDIEAKASGAVDKEQLALMLRTLLAERFRLAQHRETKELRVYELVTDKAGPKIQAIKDGETPANAVGLHFHGDLRLFADFLAIRLAISVSDDPGRPGRASGPPVPVLDKTGLPGIYDFGVDVKPEPGSDTFNLWQRVLRAAEAKWRFWWSTTPRKSRPRTSHGPRP
jgi:uncharacterized protein (TIGR03435 family)